MAKIFDIADASHRYMGNAMLLALVTGQRLGDISRMKFSDIWDDHLHIIQKNREQNRHPAFSSSQCD